MQYIKFSAAPFHVHTCNILLQVKSMHAGNQSKAASKLFSFHLNRSHSFTSLCSQILNVYPQAVKVNLSACASYAIGASAAHCPHITKGTEQHLSTLSSVTPPFFPASISTQLIFRLHRSQANKSSRTD